MTTKERRYAQLQAASDARWYVYQVALEGMAPSHPKTRTVEWAIECLMAAGVIVATGKIGRLTAYRVVKDMSESEVRGLVAKRENTIRTMGRSTSAPSHFPPLPVGMSVNSALDYLDRVARSLLLHCRRLEAMIPGARPWMGGDLTDVSSRPPEYLKGGGKLAGHDNKPPVKKQRRKTVI